MPGGFVARVYHAILTYGSALGAGLGATQDNEFPKLTNQLWAASLIGVPIVGVPLVLTMMRYRMTWWWFYAAGWVVVITCVWAGSWTNAGGYSS